jgi:hypothetical protein
VKASEHESVGQLAAAVARSVAQKIDASNADELLRMVKQDPVQIEIIKATYGAGDKQKDVTEMLSKLVGDFPVISLPSSQYNEAFGSDPAQGVPKTLKVVYRMNGKEGQAEFKENAPIILPVPQ